MLEVHTINNAEDLELAFQIRREVFIIGQNVDEEIEMDEYDDSAIHVLALQDNKAVGTARWRQTGEGIKLERFAVLETARGMGVGTALVDYVLNDIPKGHRAYLNAQVEVIPFYALFGFVAEGPVFEEADIPHRKMLMKEDITP